MSHVDPAHIPNPPEIVYPDVSGIIDTGSSAPVATSEGYRQLVKNHIKQIEQWGNLKGAGFLVSFIHSIEKSLPGLQQSQNELDSALDEEYKVLHALSDLRLAQGDNFDMALLEEDSKESRAYPLTVLHEMGLSSRFPDWVHNDNSRREILSRFPSGSVEESFRKQWAVIRPLRQRWSDLEYQLEFGRFRTSIAANVVHQLLIEVPAALELPPFPEQGKGVRFTKTERRRALMALALEEYLEQKNIDPDRLTVSQFESLIQDVFQEATSNPLWRVRYNALEDFDTGSVTLMCRSIRENLEIDEPAEKSLRLFRTKLKLTNPDIS